MTSNKIDVREKKLGHALEALEQIASVPPKQDRAYIDATIQRFEFTIELFWKFLKALLEEKGVEVQYPKDVLQEAYKGHLIDDEQAWIHMLQDRNMTSHTYDEKLADEIYLRIQTYIPVFRRNYDKLSFQSTN